jgi:hypothetical protein
MKKRQLFFILFFSLLLLPVSSILPQTDPFRINETGPVTVKSQDVFLFWMEDIGGGNIKNYQKVYRYKTDGILLPLDSLDIDTMLTNTQRRQGNRPGKNSFVDVASGQFNRDPYDDIAAIWRTSDSNQKIEIMISRFDTTGFFTNTTPVTLDAGKDIRQDEEIYVRTGDFDADSLDEFLVAFRDLSDSVIFYLYNVDSTLQVSQTARYCNTKVGGSSLSHFVKYFIETADLNGDGIDEIVLSTWETAVTSTVVPITIRVYSVENGVIVPKGTTIVNVPKSSVTGLQDFIMASAKGQFDDDDSDELVFSAVVKSDFIHVSHHYILNVSQNLQTISVGPRQQYTMISDFPFFINDITEFGLTTGDLNKNGRDEVIFAAGKNIRVCAVNDDYTFTVKSDVGVANAGPSDYTQSNNYLKAKDVNMDSRDDIIVVKNIVLGSNLDGFEIAAITFPDSTLTDGTEKVFARRLRDESQNDVYQPYAIAVGNFDGFDFTVGTPSLYHEYGIVQPVVLLNAPPVHFDMLNGNIYDVNGCYNGGDCDFWSLYKKQSTSSVEVKTEVHNDWEVSAGAKVEGQITASPMGVGVNLNYKVWATGKYGKHFSKDQTNRTTVSVSVEVEAREDDRIYSTIADYDVWEYPVFHGNEPFARRSYFALVPKNVQATWYGSKSYFAQQYIPDHEVSNILSYYPYDTLSNNPNLSQIIRASYVSDRFSLDGSSSYSWNLAITDFEQNGADTTRDMGIDAGAELGGVSTSFKFDNKKMSTHTTSVENLIDLRVHLGNVNMGIGDVKYSVTPYAYWGTNDALVIDYAVQPELAPIGFPPTWWQDKYGNNPDPTFVLPWRLDPEKGFALGDPDKRFQTKDITFLPRKPITGDTLTISARVRNFSLKATSTPVSVKFYLDDPDSGGTPIIGVNGTNTVTTNGVINVQGTADVKFKWVVPNGLPAYPRIYAVLDQENAIAEIHEDNNKGYNILGVSPVLGLEDVDNIVPEDYALYQSYPNPFNPSTTIKYSIPYSDIVNIKVFDILGREVAVLINEYKTAGTYSIEFNASRFSSGVYFYQLHSGNYFETKKMVLLK